MAPPPALPAGGWPGRTWGAGGAWRPRDRRAGRRGRTRGRGPRPPGRAGAVGSGLEGCSRRTFSFHGATVPPTLTRRRAELSRETAGAEQGLEEGGLHRGPPRVHGDEQGLAGQTLRVLVEEEGPAAHGGHQRGGGPQGELGRRGPGPGHGIG